MVDDVPLNKIATIERYFQRTSEDCRGPKHTLATYYMQLDPIALNPQRTCEVVIELLIHMARKQRLGPPLNSRNAFAMTEQARLIDIATHMRALVGLSDVANHSHQGLTVPISLGLPADCLTSMLSNSHAA